MALKVRIEIEDEEAKLKFSRGVMLEKGIAPKDVSRNLKTLAYILERTLAIIWGVYTPKTDNEIFHKQHQKHVKQMEKRNARKDKENS